MKLKLYRICILILIGSFFTCIHADNFSDPLDATGISISSPVNARGVQNVDGAATAQDAVEQVLLDLQQVETIIQASSCNPIFISQADIPLNITTSGVYLVTEDLVDSGGGNAITISTDGVVIDLCGFEVSGTSSTTAFLISGNSSVIIRNGTIRAVSKALEFNASGQNVLFENIVITETFDETITVNTISGFCMRNCHFYDCLTDAGNATTVFISLDSSENVLIEDCTINNNGSFNNTASNLVLVLFSTCFNSIIRRTSINSNTWLGNGTFFCIVFGASENNVVQDVRLVENEVGGTSNRIVAVDIFHSPNTLCERVYCADNDGPNVTSFGGQCCDFLCAASDLTLNRNMVFVECVSKNLFRSFPSVNDNIQAFRFSNRDMQIDRCIAINSRGRGFHTQEKTIMRDCIASGCDSIGFFLNRATKLLRCISVNNIRGFRFAGANTESEARLCQALNNSLDGFSVNTAQVLLLGNVSCGNPSGNYVSTANAIGVITSPANAYGWDNIDCDDTTGNIIESKVCVLETEVQTVFCNPLLITQADVSGGTYTINSSGTYLVTENLSASGTIITIDADNVTLDLKGHRMSGATSWAIDVAQDHENITIQNGIIDASASGIQVQQGCVSVTIRDMSIEDIDNQGIYLNGVNANEIRNALIERCSIQRVGVYAQSMQVYGIRMNYCFDSRIRLSDVLSSGNSTDNFRGIHVNDSTRCLIGQVKISECEGANLFEGIYLNNITHFFVSHTIVSDCTGGQMRSYWIINGGTRPESCVLRNNLSENNIGTSSFSHAIQISDEIDGIIIDDFRAVGNENQSNQFLRSINFNALSSSFGLQNAIVQNCISMNNRSFDNPMQSYYVNRGTNIAYINCYAEGNESIYSQNRDFALELNTSTEMKYINCVAKASNDTGFENTTSITNSLLLDVVCQGHGVDGFNFGSTTNVAVLRCLAAQNGTTNFAGTFPTGPGAGNKSPVATWQSDSEWDNIDKTPYN